MEIRRKNLFRKKEEGLSVLLPGRSCLTEDHQMPVEDEPVQCNGIPDAGGAFKDRAIHWPGLFRSNFCEPDSNLTIQVTPLFAKLFTQYAKRFIHYAK